MSPVPITLQNEMPPTAVILISFVIFFLIFGLVIYGMRRSTKMYEDGIDKCDTMFKGSSKSQIQARSNCMRQQQMLGALGLFIATRR
jgi:hypothetical protein